VAKVYNLKTRYKGKDDEAQRVLDCVSQVKAATSDLADEWFHAVTFTRGNQWTYLDPQGGGIQHIPRVPWRIRVVDNQTLPQVTHMVALLLQNRPTFQALARNSEEEDVLAAYGFEGLLQYDWDRLNLSHLLSRTISGAMIMGNYFWRIGWNPLAGRPLLAPSQVGEGTLAAKDSPRAEDPKSEKVEEEQEFFVPGMEVEIEVEQETVYEGDVDVTPVSPFNFGVDLAATDLRRAAWCYQEAYVHRDVLADRIGEKAKDLVSDVSAEEYAAYDQQLRFDSYNDLTSDQALDLIRVIEFWEAPTKKHPEGRVITVAGGQTIDVKKNPYGGRFPFVHFGAIQVEGRFWCDGMVRHLVPLQQMHNKAVSRYHEIMNLSANPKVIADAGALTSETSVNDQPGEIIFKKRGTDVRFVTPPPPSSIHPTIMSMAMNAMQSITGVNDPLAGQNPPNVRAGSTVRYLQEAGMRRFLPIALQMEKAIKETGQMLMYLHQRFSSEDMMFQVLGKQGKPEMHWLKRSHIDRIQDVTIIHGSMMPKSPAAQQETMIQMLQYAPFLFVDENGQMDKEHIFRVLDMPTARGRVSLDGKQRTRVYQEHIDVTEGREIVVQPYDNDMLHMRLHAARLSDMEWFSENQEAAMRLMQHYAEHEMQIKQKQSGQMLDINAGASPDSQGQNDRTATPAGPSEGGGNVPPTEGGPGGPGLEALMSELGNLP
jgi:hypothetical protein